MIQELREYSNNIFFKLLLGVIAITFVLSFGVGGFFGDRKEVIAKVNDNEILLKEYREAYQNRLRLFQQQFGENAEQFAEQLNLRQQVFDQLIERYLLLINAAEINLVATDLEVQDYIKKQTFFQKNGLFDYETYEAVLNQNRIVRHEYEDSLRTDILLAKKKQLLTSGIFINDAEVDKAYRRNFEKIEVEYVFFDPQMFIKNIKINDNQLRKYHKNNPNKFKTLNQFRIEYFRIVADFFKDKLKVKEREIRRYYKKYSDNYVIPPEIKARHILLKIVPDAPEKVMVEKREVLKKLLEKLKTGETFEDLAKKHSEDGTSEEGGDLGWFRPGEMVPAFEDAAFSLEIGQVSEIVQTPFGLHLIKIDDRKEKVVKSLENVRDQIIDILSDSRAQKRLDEETERLSVLAGEAFYEEAKKLNLEVNTSEWFDKNSIIQHLGSTSELVTKLQQKEPGEIGLWKRNSILGNVIFKLIENKKPETRNFEDAKEDVFTALRLEKAEKKAIETAKNYFTKVQNNSDISKLTKMHGLKTESIIFTAKTIFLPKIGENKEFRKVSLNLNENHKFGLSLNQNTAHLIKFKKRSLNEEEESNLKNKVKSQILQNIQQSLLTKELKRLKNSASIEIINPLFRNPQSS